MAGEDRHRQQPGRQDLRSSQDLRGTLQHLRPEMYGKGILNSVSKR